jgi:hypothetical protein
MSGTFYPRYANNTIKTVVAEQRLPTVRIPDFPQRRAVLPDPNRIHTAVSCLVHDGAFGFASGGLS